MDSDNSQDQTVPQSFAKEPSGSFRLQVNQADIPPKTIKSRHLEAWIIFSGLDANKPTTGTQNIQAYWAWDTKKLYLWNPTSKTFNYASFT